MGRTKLRGIDWAGVRIAIEVPSALAWTWPDSLEKAVCPPIDPDVYVAVRVGAPRSVAADPIVYSHPRGTFEVGSRGRERWIAVYGGGADLGGPTRVARFDADYREGEVTVAPGFAARGLFPLGAPLDEIVWLHRIVDGGGLLVRGALARDGDRVIVFLGDACASLGGEGASDDARWIALRRVGAGVRAWPMLGGSDDALALRGARVAGVHLCESGEATTDSLDRDAAVAALLRSALAPVHEPDAASRLCSNAVHLAERLGVVRVGTPPRVPAFEWGRREAGLCFSLPRSVSA